MGCLLTGFVVFLAIEIFGSGTGFPHTYWLEFGDVQAFDGADGVVLFVQVERRMRYAGAFRSPPIHKAAQLWRIDVAPDGRSRRTSLTFAEGVNFNTNVTAIFKRPDHFYLADDRPTALSPVRLHRVLEGRIEPLDGEETSRLLREMGFGDQGSRALINLKSFDRISAQDGWQRLNGTSDSFRRHDPIILSRRHGLRFRLVQDGQSEAIVAEPLSEAKPSSKKLAEVSTKPWKSYQSPLE